MTVHRPGREIAISEFKARCLALIDEVAQTGEALVITKRGRRLARLEPIDAPPSLLGSVSFLVDDAELIAPIDETWDVES